MNDVQNSEGYRKAKELTERLKKEKETKLMAEEKKNELALADLKSKNSLGMKGITAEDIRPPMAFLVQAIKDKSELCDMNGKECPDGKIFLKGANEILDEIDCYFIYLKKDHYQKEGSKWDGVRMYKTICVRAEDMKPFAINFQKSSLGAVSDLITTVTSGEYPLFVYKTLIKVVKASNKEGIEYYKLVVNVRGIEEDSSKLAELQDLAIRFDLKSNEDNLEQVAEEDLGAVEENDDLPF